MRELSKAKTDYKPQVNIAISGSGTESFVFDTASERSAFLGCVLVYNQRTYNKKIECQDFEPAVPARFPNIGAGWLYNWTSTKVAGGSGFEWSHDTGLPSTFETTHARSCE